MTAVPNQQPGLLGGLLRFLQSPQARGLSQGLLAQASPSMTEPRSLSGGISQGLQLGEKYADEEKQRLLQQGHLDISRGHLDLAKQKLPLELAQHDLEKLYKMAQIGEINEKAAQRKKRIEWLQEYTKGNLGGTPTEGESQDDAARRERAGLLAAAGYDEEAFKVLSEKREKDITKQPTQSFVTTNQEIIQAADNAIPVIDKLLETETPGAITGYSPWSADEKADYNSDVITLGEALLKARNLSNTEGTLKKIIETLEIKPFESQESYKKRLQGVKKEILDRRERASKITPVGGKSETSNIQKKEDDPLGIRKDE